MLESWHSYPSIFALGHRALSELLLDPVIVQEKVDGSQFSFGVFDCDKEPALSLQVGDGRYLLCRSKGAVLNIIAPDKMFAPGVETAKRLAPDLVPNWTYRGEYLAKPKHNALAYERIPRQHVILFDVNTGHEEYAATDVLQTEADRLGLDIVPLLHEGMVTDVAMVREFLSRISCLGGQPVEGVVIKNYARFGPDKKALMGKFVSEAFKEVHAAEWKKDNPSSGDVIDTLIGRYRTPARWEKAVQHLRDAGTLTDSPRDIGELFKEVPADVEKECADEIRDMLYAWAWPKIRRGVAAGVAEWYKDRLLAQQFTQPDENTGLNS